MLEFYLRTSCQKYFIDKIAEKLAPVCSANVVTWLALIFGILSPLFLY